MGRTLYLHAGHGKTGTSFVQALLAANSQRLLNAGICYPMRKTVERAVRAGEVTSANIHFKNLHLWEKTDFASGDGCSFAFSDEVLWYRFINDKTFLEEVGQLRKKLGFSVKVLFFYRPLVSYFRSVFRQRVKSGDQSQSIGEREFICSATSLQWCETLDQFIGLMESQEIELACYNYHEVRENMIGVTSDFLGVELVPFDESESNINPSWTADKTKRALSIRSRLAFDQKEYKKSLRESAAEELNLKITDGLRNLSHMEDKFPNLGAEMVKELLSDLGDAERAWSVATDSEYQSYTRLVELTILQLLANLPRNETGEVFEAIVRQIDFESFELRRHLVRILLETGQVTLLRSLPLDEWELLPGDFPWFQALRYSSDGEVDKGLEFCLQSLSESRRNMMEKAAWGFELAITAKREDMAAKFFEFARPNLSQAQEERWNDRMRPRKRSRIMS